MNDEIILASALKEELEKLPKQRFYSFGKDLPVFDSAVGQMAQGDFIVLGGQAGQGKTALAIDITKSIIQNKMKPLWFSIELTPREFLEKFNENDMQFFYMPREIREPRLSWLEKRIDEAIEKYKIDIVFIDHLGMIMDENDYRNRTGTEILDERLKIIKGWAVNKGIIIVGISVVTQDTNKTKTEPTLAVFKGTSAIGHTADLALYIERHTGVKKSIILNERLDEDTSPLSSEADLYILKCRRTGMIKAKVRLIMGGDNHFIEIQLLDKQKLL